MSPNSSELLQMSSKTAARTWSLLNCRGSHTHTFCSSCGERGGPAQRGFVSPSGQFLSEAEMPVTGVRLPPPRTPRWPAASQVHLPPAPEPRPLRPPAGPRFVALALVLPVPCSSVGSSRTHAASTATPTLPFPIRPPPQTLMALGVAPHTCILASSLGPHPPTRDPGPSPPVPHAHAPRAAGDWKADLARPGDRGTALLSPRPLSRSQPRLPPVPCRPVDLRSPRCPATVDLPPTHQFPSPARRDTALSVTPPWDAPSNPVGV